MSQFVLLLTIYCVGTLVCLASVPTGRVHVCAALGFLIGLAVFVGFELLLLGIGLVLTPVVFWGGIGVVAAGSVAAIVRRGWPNRRELIALALWTLGYAAIIQVWIHTSIGTFSYDSHYLMMMAGVIADDRVLTAEVLVKLGDYGIFQVIAQSLGWIPQKAPVWALCPMIASSTVIAFATLLHSGLAALGVRTRWQWLAIGLVTVATFSMYMLFRHAFYIQTNLGTASYLFVFCAVFWLAETEGDPSLLPIAFIALFALALQRIEAPLICTLFAAIAVLPSRLPRRPMIVALGVASIAIAAWFLLLASVMSPLSEFLTPNRCYMMATILLVFTAYVAVSHWTQWRLLDRINRSAPLVLAAVLVLGLVAAFALRYDHMATSADGWLTCLREAPYWQGAWHATLLLALIGLATKAPPNRWMFVVGVPAYMIMVLLLVLNRTPYYVGIGDSASRMAIHPLPIVWFYFALKFIPLLSPPRP